MLSNNMSEVKKFDPNSLKIYPKSLSQLKEMLTPP
jgi:hypothetical protein